MAYIREISVEQPLVDAVKERGGVAYKFTSPGRRAVPDRLVMLPGGVMFFVECKAPGQVPTPQQLREHTRMRALGAHVVVLDNQFDIKELLDTAQGIVFDGESRICAAEGCLRPRYCKGLCKAHYQKKRRETPKGQAYLKMYHLRRKLKDAGFNPDEAL